jgi:hypothetical protein
MKLTGISALATAALLGLAQPLSANVITDWNDTALKYVLGRSMGPPPAERVIAMTHLAMFDAVNSIEPKYRPYVVRVPASFAASKEAAAASAAATVLASVNPQTRAEIETQLANYLGAIPEGPAKMDGVKLGRAVAAKILEARAEDGSSAPDAYRPKAAAGEYVPTPVMFAAMWPSVKPFALTSVSQFRPAPPVALTSVQWAADYNEIKALGRKDSTARSPDQSEAARFWLNIGGDVYYPLVHAVAAAKKLDLLDTARLFALVSIARADGLTAVFEAKYHYNFWRPITAIRNGDIDDNPETERDASWAPIADTPMHPEYPCAHCIQAASTCAVLEAIMGTHDINEVSMTSRTAPGVTRRWNNLREFVAEVSQARIWAGFHYRFSTLAGEAMGRQIGEYVVSNFMQPMAVAAR